MKNKPYALTLRPAVLELNCKVIAYELRQVDPVQSLLLSSPRNFQLLELQHDSHIEFSLGHSRAAFTSQNRRERASYCIVMTKSRSFLYLISVIHGL